MSDFNENNLVVQSNELIRQVNWNLDTVPLKIFKILISCIDTKNPPKDNTIIITKKELYDILGSNEHYEHIRKQVKSLQSKIVELKKDNGDIVSLSIMPYVTWKNNSELVICEFGRGLMPYLIELKERFTKYNVMNVKAFKSRYGLIIYEYLLSLRYQKEPIYYVKMNDLRRMTGTTKLYKRFINFEERVLKPAMEDINSGTLEFLVKYEKIKIGRFIDGIQFYTRERNTYKENSFDTVILREDQIQSLNGVNKI